MKKNFNACALTALAALFLFQACIKDNTGIASGKYNKGVFIVNEGSSLVPGTVSFYNRDSAYIVNDIYNTANGGAKLNGPLNFITTWLAKTYLVGPPGTLTDVNPYTFQIASTISDTNIIQPHYFLGIPAYTLNSITVNKAYISDWGVNGQSGNILVYNLDSKQVTASFPIGKGVSKLLAVNSSYAYAINSGGSGVDSSFALIDIKADTVIKYYFIGVNPNSLKQDANNDVWVLADSVNDGRTNVGKLSRLHNGSIDLTFDVPKHSSHLATDLTAHYLFFSGGDGKLYRKDIINFGVDAPVPYSIPGVALTSPYGLDFDPQTGYMFVTDAKDKNSPATLYVVDITSGAVIKSGQVGVRPGSFLFQ